MGRGRGVEVRGSGRDGWRRKGELCKDKSMAEGGLGRDRKKMCGWKVDTLRREALKTYRVRLGASELMPQWPVAAENGVGVVPL